MFDRLYGLYELADMLISHFAKNAEFYTIDILFRHPYALEVLRVCELRVMSGKAAYSLSLR